MAKYLEFMEEVTVTGSELQMCNANLFYRPRGCLHEWENRGLNRGI